MRRRRPELQPQQQCSLRTRLGRRLKHIPESGQYDVCLSPTQVQALFHGKNPGPALGCGTFACVWPTSGQRLVKLTRDRDDVTGLEVARGMRHVVKVFDARELPQAGYDLRTKRRIPVYAVTVERLKPLSRPQQKALSRPLERARMAMLHLARKHRGQPASFRVEPEVQASLATRACKLTPGPGCERFTRSFFDTWAELFRRGVVWQDAHTGNVAMDERGGWKAIDLGYSGTRKRTKIPVLRGAWR